MKKLDKATKVLAKLGEVACWIGAVGMLVGLVLVLVMGEKAIVGSPAPGETANTCGFEIMVVGAQGEIIGEAVGLYLVTGAVLMGLMAMVLRNVYLILKNSENATPFQKDNVRMVREIGIFLIAVPAASLVMSIVARLVVGPETAEISVDLGNILPGLVVLCLSQFFARGMELETEMDGLL